MLLTVKNKNEEDIERVVKALRSHSEGEYDVQIKKHTGKRSDRMNRYYWGVVLQVLHESTGEDKNILHELMASKFLSLADIMIGGKVYARVRSTAELDNKEFVNYLENIWQWALQDLGIDIPRPNENLPVDYDIYSANLKTVSK